MPEVGDILGEKYRLLKVIGAGGMGRVYEAEHLELGKNVAIKFPQEELVDDPRALARFRQEPRTVAATGHPGIVDVYDVGTTDDQVPYVVMEYLQGESLGTLLARERRLDVSMATSLIAQVLSAIAAAHEKKIIHRDLKPDNVFLIDTGQRLPSVKILDFGTSKILGDLTGGARGEKLTESGAILGTPFYMAPEQILDDEKLDHRLDIYAVGVMFYELLTGQLPFASANVLSLAHKVLNDEVRRPTELCPGLPEGLEEVVLRALARDRRQRFRSAAAMLQALLPYLDERALGQLSMPAQLRGQSAPSRLSRGGEEEDHAADDDEVTAPPPRWPTTARARALAAIVVVLIVIGAVIALGRALTPGVAPPEEARTEAASLEGRAASVVAPLADAGVAATVEGGDDERAPTVDAVEEATADASAPSPEGDAALGDGEAHRTSAAPPHKNRPLTRPRRVDSGASTPVEPEAAPPQKKQGGSLEFTNEWNPE